MAENGNVIISCIGLEKHYFVGLLRSFAVNEEFRGLKIGNLLYKSLIVKAKKVKLRRSFSFNKYCKELF